MSDRVAVYSGGLKASNGCRPQEATTGCRSIKWAYPQWGSACSTTPTSSRCTWSVNDSSVGSSSFSSRHSAFRAVLDPLSIRSRSSRSRGTADDPLALPRPHNCEVATSSEDFRPERRGTPGSEAGLNNLSRRGATSFKTPTGGSGNSAPQKMRRGQRTRGSYVLLRATARRRGSNSIRSSPRPP